MEGSHPIWVGGIGDFRNEFLVLRQINCCEVSSSDFFGERIVLFIKLYFHNVKYEKVPTHIEENEEE